MHLRLQKHGNAEKSGLRDVKRANFIRYWRRSGLTESGLTEVSCMWHLFEVAKEETRHDSYEHVHRCTVCCKI